MRALGRRTLVRLCWAPPDVAARPRCASVLRRPFKRKNSVRQCSGEETEAQSGKLATSCAKDGMAITCKKWLHRTCIPRYLRQLFEANFGSECSAED